MEKISTKKKEKKEETEKNLSSKKHQHGYEKLLIDKIKLNIETDMRKTCSKITSKENIPTLFHFLHKALFDKH